MGNSFKLDHKWNHVINCAAVSCRVMFSEPIHRDQLTKSLS